MMNKEQELRKELRFLLANEIDKEIELYRVVLNDNNTDVKKLSKEIYLKRGIDIDKLEKDNNPLEILNIFNSSDKVIKKKIITELIVTIIILLLLKIPFDLVRDIGYDYISFLSTNSLYHNTWNILFLVLYTVSFILILIYSIKSLNKKYTK